MKQYLIVTPDIYELPIAVHDTVKEISATYGIPLQSVYTAIHNHSVNRKINARIEEVEVGFYLGDHCALSTNSAQNTTTLRPNKTNKKTKFRQKRTTIKVTLPIATADKVIALANSRNKSVSSTIRMMIEGCVF